MTNAQPVKSLVDERLDRGWTQGDMAVRCGVSVGTVVSWEKGRDTPQPRNMTLLADVLELPVKTVRSWFISADEKPATPAGQLAAV